MNDPHSERKPSTGDYARGWADACLHIQAELEKRSGELTIGPDPMRAWMFARRYAEWAGQQAEMGKTGARDLEGPTTAIGPEHRPRHAKSGHVGARGDSPDDSGRTYLGFTPSREADLMKKYAKGES